MVSSLKSHKNQLSMTDKRHTKLSKDNLNEFRKLVRKSLGELEGTEENVFYAIPESIWQDIFNTNFGNDLSFAQKHLLGIDKGRINHRKSEQIEDLMSYIDNYHKSIELFENALKNDEHIIILTDTDNDGSFAQSIAHTMRSALTPDENSLVHIQYARAVETNKTRGFTSELVAELLEQYGISQDEKCLIITADNGINSLSEQKKINILFPNATLLITDHHNPEVGMCIEENDKTFVFNPHYFGEQYCDPDLYKVRLKENKDLANQTNKPYKNDKRNKSRQFFQEFNISGATTFGLLAKAIVKNRTPDRNSLTLSEQLYYKELLDHNHSVMERIDILSDISNMLDYVHTHPDHKPMNLEVIDKSLELQSLLNTVNSMNQLILNQISDDVATELVLRANKDGVSDFDVEIVLKENRHAQSLNTVAHLILSDYFHYQHLLPEEKKEWDENDAILNNRITSLIQGEIFDNDFRYYSGNENYIEQLRPLIFNLMVDDNKSLYEKYAYEKMIEVFKHLKRSERNIMDELRKINMADTYNSEHVSITVINEDMQRVFNRKLLGKTYNKANNGFAMILDGSTNNSFSGSFRSNYDISDIFGRSKKEKIEKQFKVIIETPGHERAAGFIVRNNGNSQFDDKLRENIIVSIAGVLENNIQQVKNKPNHTAQNDIHIISDLHSLSILSKINANVRGMVAHFQRLTPLVKLDPHATVTVNQSTGEQFSMVKIAQENEYGWTPLTVKMSNKEGKEGVTVLIPNSVLVEMDKNDFKDYMRLNYMSDGTYVFDSIVHEHEVDLTLPQLFFERNYEGSQEMEKFFKKQMETNQYIEYLDNTALKNLPFFQYNVNGEEDFQLYQSYVIEQLQQSGKSYSTTLDVEAAGFGNAPLFNIGLMTYFIDENSGTKVTKQQMRTNSIELDGFSYYTTDSANIESLLKDEFFLKPSEFKRRFNMSIVPSHLEANYNGMALVMNPVQPNGTQYPLGKNVFNFSQYQSLFTKVHNSYTHGSHITFNREIKAENVSFLIKPDTYVIPSPLERLTNIDNEIAMKYGKPIGEVDDFISKYLTDKMNKGNGMIITAHNTGYDARIVNSNLRKTSNLLFNPQNIIADSMDISKDMKLFYFNTDILTFPSINGLSDIYFYSPQHADWGLRQMLQSNADEAEVYDINGVYSLSKKRNSTGDYDYFIYDSKRNITAQLDMDIKTQTLDDKKRLELAEQLKVDVNSLPDTIKINLNDLVAKSSYSVLSRIIRKKKTKRGEVLDEPFEWIHDEPTIIDNKAVDKTIPLNAVRSNANGIGETLAINNFMNWIIKDEQYQLKTLNLANYPALLKNQALIEVANDFMSNYNFEFSTAQNLETIFYDDYVYKSIHADLMPHPDDPVDAIQNSIIAIRERNNALRELAHDFIDLNSDIAKVYDNRNIYKFVLQHYQPKMMSDLNKANYENVAHLTGVPTQTVEKILNYAYAYIQEFKHLGCDSVLQVEQHNNGLTQGKYAGDTAFEAVAVGLMASKNCRGSKNAVYKFLDFADDFTMKLYNQFLNGDKVAIDSMSFKQHQLYLGRDENNHTRIMERLIERSDELISSNENHYRIVNFKLKGDTLGAGKHLYAVVKPDVQLDREQLDKDSKMFDYLMKIQQISFVDNHVYSLKNIYDSVSNKLHQMRDDLQERYIYVEMNESRYYTDNYSKSISDLLTNKTITMEDAIHQMMKTNIYKNNNLHSIVGVENVAGMSNIIDYSLIRAIPNYLNVNGLSKTKANKDLNNLIQVILNPEKLDEIKFSNPVSQELANQIAWVKKFRTLSPEDLKLSFGASNNGNLKDISISHFENTLYSRFENLGQEISKHLTIMAMNEVIVNHKLNYAPSNLNKVMNYLNQYGEDGFKQYWDTQMTNNASIFSGAFLNLCGSTIKRNSPSGYMHKYFSFVELGGQAIHDRYVSGIVPLQIFNNPDLNNQIQLNLENQMELPTEVLSIPIKLK